MNVFDKTSRFEQKKVEHVNNFIKQCKILSNDVVYHHSRFNLIVGAVFICCGLYNYKKKKGYAYLPPNQKGMAQKDGSVNQEINEQEIEEDEDELIDSDYSDALEVDEEEETDNDTN